MSRHSPRPFEQLAFGEVPEAPRVAHPFFDARSERVVIRTRPYGSIGVRVVRYGTGPALICVHGFMTTSYSFRYLLEPLGRRHTVVAFDLPGAGESDKPSGPYDPDSLADAIGDIVDGLELRGSPAIGNSLGGYLAMKLALRDPASLGRLVCLHAPGLATARMRALRLALDALPRTKQLIEWLVRLDPERWVHNNVHYWDESLKSREEHREYARPLRTREGVSAFTHMLDETLDVRRMLVFEAELRRLRGRFPIPLQLVYARRDPMVPPEVGSRLAALLPDCPIAWLDQASHFAHVDAPAAFLAVAEPFLEAGASGGP